MSRDTAITGVILAGGQATRMGGRDKGLARLDEQRLIDHTIASFRPQTERLLISANRNLDHYRRLGHPVLEDHFGGYLGPLAGIHAALSAMTEGLLATVPCDSPLLPADLVERLRRGLLEQPGAEIACVEVDGRLHPVFSLIRHTQLADLDAYLAGGGRAVYRWFNSRRLARVDYSDCPDCFTNVNTPEELQQIEQLLRQRRMDALAGGA